MNWNAAPRLRARSQSRTLPANTCRSAVGHCFSQDVTLALHALQLALEFADHRSFLHRRRVTGRFGAGLTHPVPESRVADAFDRLAPLLPDWSVIGGFDDIAWWCAEQTGTIIVDGTEFGVAPPTGQAAQRPFYSRKKKTHTHKTIAVSDAVSNLMWVTPLVGGATHDLTALRDANLPVHLSDSGLDVLADSGFQGLQHDVAGVDLPTRRRRCDGELTKTEKIFNTGGPTFLSHVRWVAL